MDVASGSLTLQNVTLSNMTPSAGTSAQINVSGTVGLDSTDIEGDDQLDLENGATFDIGSGGSDVEPISGFGFGDTIDATGVSGGSASVANGVLTITNGTNSVALKLVNDTLSDDEIHYGGDGANGTDVTYTQRTPATADILTPTLNLGNVHPGGVVNGGAPNPLIDPNYFEVENTAYGGGENIVGGVSSITGPFVDFGSFYYYGYNSAGSPSVAPGQIGYVGVAVSPTSSDGVVTGSATLDLSSESANALNDPIATNPIALTATVYDLANPVFSAAPVLAARVGDAAPSGVLTLTDGTSADPYQEDLNYRVDSATGAEAISNDYDSGTIASGAGSVLRPVVADQSSRSSRRLDDVRAGFERHREKAGSGKPCSTTRPSR